MSIHRIARYARRPLLMTPDAAAELAWRALKFDAGAMRHERLARSPGAFLKRLGVGNFLSREAFDDDAGPTAPPRPMGYAPAYAGPPEFEGYGWSLCEGIACIDIEGALIDRGFLSISGVMFWGYDTIAQVLKEAYAHPHVRGIFIRMNSPGGVVAGTLEACTADIRAMRESGNANGKPIFVYADMAASAAYWIGAQADMIYAPPVGMVGSIGVVLVHEDYSGALEKDGVKVTSIQFGAKKTDGAWWKPLSDGAKADLQAEIDELGERFIADVMAGREFLSRGAILATEAACFMASHSDAARSGLKRNLVDKIATEEVAFRALLDHVGLVSTPTPQPEPAQASTKSRHRKGRAGARGGGSKKTRRAK